mmetsp:Transcript_14360/g.60740  ORF Transcript_14360/g.60740 Transcript_14360/m.60740 type:complete len:238 (-) Transcript_14360:287-1000(-)
MRRGRARLPRRPATHPVRAPRRVRPGAGCPPAARDAPGKRHGRRPVRRGESLRADHGPPPAERLPVPVGGGPDVRGGGRVRGVDRGRDLRVPRAHAIRPRGAHGVRRRHDDTPETTAESRHRRSRGAGARAGAAVPRARAPRGGTEGRRGVEGAETTREGAREVGGGEAGTAKYAIVRRRGGRSRVGGGHGRGDPRRGDERNAERGVVAAVRRRGGGRRRGWRGERPRTQGPRRRQG